MIAPSHFHVGFLVESLEGAMDDLNLKLGLRWRQVNSLTVGEWPLKVVYSQQGPPYVELVEAPSKSPWDIGSPGLLHLGYWADDFAADIRELEQRGIAQRYDGTAFGFSLHEGPQWGIELIDAAPRSRYGFEKALGFERDETVLKAPAHS